MSVVLAVAIDAPLRRLFDYRAPAQVPPGSLEPGVRLWVPFGRRRVIGVLVEKRDTSEIPDSKLRTAQPSWTTSRCSTRSCSTSCDGPPITTGTRPAK